MNYGSLVPSFYFYKFAESISQPYTSFAAYKAGAIDENGNLVKPESSIDPYEYFVIKLKKIFEQLPPGLTKYQLANYTSALNYFAEEAEKYNIEKEHYIALIEGLLAAQCGPEASYIELLEDMSAGGMAVAGDSAGYNTGGVSGFDPVMAPMQRRKPVADDMYHMFDVSEADFAKISQNQMNEIDYLRRFGTRNPDSILIVRNKKDGNLYTVPKKKKLKEEYHLGEFNILNENDNSRRSEAHALRAFARHLETLGGYEEKDPSTGKIITYKPVMHPKTGKPLKSFKRKAWDDRTPLQPGEFRIAPGRKGLPDLEIMDHSHDTDKNIAPWSGPIEMKSIGKDMRTNIDVTSTSAPKSMALYLSTLANSFSLSDPIRNIVNKARGLNVPQTMGDLPSNIRRQSSLKVKELRKKYGGRKVDRLRKLWVSTVGLEKGGLKIDVNPEDKVMHIMDMTPEHFHTQSHTTSLGRMMDNLGGLQITGSIVSKGKATWQATDVGLKKSSPKKKEVTPDKNNDGESSVKEVITNLEDGNKNGVPDSDEKSSGMLRISVKPMATQHEIGFKNGEIAFGEHRVGQFYQTNPRTSITNSKQIIQDLSSGK
jgi:hypothetical protein